MHGRQTDNAEEETNNKFCSSLQAVLDDIPRHNFTLLMGDFNARIRVVGQHAVGDITNNDRKLVNMCEEKGFAIGGTLSSQKHPQANLDITRWKHQKPYRPHHDKHSH